jgi:hypothetical protein
MNPDVAGDLRDAVVILAGTGRYEQSKVLPSISIAEPVIRRLHEALREICEFPEQSIKLIVDPRSPEDFQAEIGAALADAPGRPVIFYYLGHGLVAQDERLYLATTSANLTPDRVEATWLAFDTVLETLGVAAPAVVILDCRYSGRTAAVSHSHEVFKTFAERRGGFLLTSASSRKAFVSRDGDRPQFTGALLEVLDRGAAECGRRLTLDDVAEQLKLRLHRHGAPAPRRSSFQGAGTLEFATNQYVRPAGRREPKRWKPFAIAAGAVVVVAAGTAFAATKLGSGPEPTPSAACTAVSSKVDGVTLSSPCDGADIDYCETVTGTSDLPAGKTLVLTQQNLDGTQLNFFSTPENWDTPGALATWHAVVYFGNRSHGQGQQYRLTVVVADRAEVRRSADDAKSHARNWSGEQQFPGEVAVQVTVHRRTTEGTPSCE